jgi:hypothetical protein
MRLTPQITFRGMDPSAAAEEAVFEQAARLLRFADWITACRVSIDREYPTPGRDRYTIHLTVALPWDELSVTRDAGEGAGAKDPSGAIRDAFDTVARLLEDEKNSQPHNGRHCEPLPHAHVRLLMHDRDRGLLEAADGRAVYFHKGSVVNADFDTLPLGTEVVYIDGFGGLGHQASAVRVVGLDGAA